jgi:hypothetical protein
MPFSIRGRNKSLLYVVGLSLRVSYQPVYTTLEPLIRATGTSHIILPKLITQRRRIHLGSASLRYVLILSFRLRVGCKSRGLRLLSFITSNVGLYAFIFSTIHTTDLAHATFV